MHVIAGDGLSALHMHRRFEAELLGGSKDRVDRKETEARAGAGRAFDAIGIGNGAAQHLVAAANAEDAATGAMMGEDVDVPAVFAQGGEIGAGRLGAGDEDEIGIARQGLAGLNQGHGDAGLGAEGIEVVEIGDARQARHGDVEAAPLPRAHVIEGEGVLGRQAGRRRRSGARGRGRDGRCARRAARARHRRGRDRRRSG